MTASRKTTKEERIQIVKECLANGCNYGETAIKHTDTAVRIIGRQRSFG